MGTLTSVSTPRRMLCSLRKLWDPALCTRSARAALETKIRPTAIAEMSVFIWVPPGDELWGLERCPFKARKCSGVRAGGRRCARVREQRSSAPCANARTARRLPVRRRSEGGSHGVPRVYRGSQASDARLGSERARASLRSPAFAAHGAGPAARNAAADQDEAGRVRGGAGGDRRRAAAPQPGADRDPSRSCPRQRGGYG